MSETVFTINRTDSFITEDPKDAFRISSGTVYVYIIPWDTETSAAGRRVPFREVEEGRVIPAFSWQDAGYQSWRFLLTAKTEQAEIERISYGATIVLKKRFLKGMGIETFEQEGYEGSLREFYRANELRDDVFLQRTRKSEPKNAMASFQKIGQAVSGGNNVSAGHTALERAVRFACGKANIDLKGNLGEDRSFGDMSMAEIAREGHFLFREVVLDHEWYKMDCGTMIGTLEGNPAVLFYAGMGSYKVYDAQNGKISPLTEQLRRKLEPKAWMIGRTLPDTPVRKKELLSFVKKSFRKGDIIGLIVLGLLTTLIGVLQPKLNQLIYDEYIPLGDMNVLLQVCMLIAAFMVGNVFISIVQKLQAYRIPCRAGYELQDAAYWRIFALPESFFRSYDSADLAQRLSGVGQIANSIISSITSNGLTLVLSLIYLIQMFTYSTKLALWGVGMLIVWNLIIYFLSRRTMKINQAVSTYDGEATGKLYQFLSGVDKIRMAGAEERAILEYIQPVANEEREKIRANRVEALVEILGDAGSVVFSMVLYYMMAQKDMRLSVGSFMAFETAFGSLNGAISGFVNALKGYLVQKPMIERVKPILETATENESGKDEVAELKGDIALDHVTFGYSEGSTVLRDLSLHISPGEYVAIVGPSGSGKSTVLKLLLGFEKPRSGRVLYDGKNIESLNKHSLRKKIGVVLQNGKLISGSIYENITITGTNPSMKDVQEVVEDVGLKEDIEQMPMGIHTVLSEAGNTISGGQQQRILIARAIYSKPAILYFDEATSALDNITQARVCESLEKRKMTRMVIAHRLSTVQNCDRILVVDHGQIVEEGNYESLMQHKGIFYQMAIRQIAE